MKVCAGASIVCVHDGLHCMPPHRRSWAATARPTSAVCSGARIVCVRRDLAGIPRERRGELVGLGDVSGASGVDVPRYTGASGVDRQLSNGVRTG